MCLGTALNHSAAMEDNDENLDMETKRKRHRISVPFIPYLSANSRANSATWYSDSILSGFAATRLPSVVVTTAPYDDDDDNDRSSRRFSYFPRKFSLQALRKFSGSSVSDAFLFVLFVAVVKLITLHGFLSANLLFFLFARALY